MNDRLRVVTVGGWPTFAAAFLCAFAASAGD
jgi:hypothetical protein